MHEMTIAQQIIGIVEETLNSHPNASCKRIFVRIGELRAVIPDSLKFAFKALTSDTTLNKTELCIESLPVVAACRSCNRQFNVQEFEFLCPACGSPNLEIQQGKELYVEKLEVNE